MKSKIVFLGLLLLFLLNANAQKKTASDWGNKFLVSSGTYFDSPIADKKWANTNGKSYTSARYAEYSGLSYVKLLAKKTMNVTLNYNIEIKKGELEVQIVDSKNNVVFEQNFTVSEKGTINADLMKDEDYQIRFNGKQAKGSYFCQWKEN